MPATLNKALNPIQSLLFIVVGQISSPKRRGGRGLPHQSDAQNALAQNTRSTRPRESGRVGKPGSQARSGRQTTEAVGSCWQTPARQTNMLSPFTPGAPLKSFSTLRAEECKENIHLRLSQQTTIILHANRDSLTALTALTA